MKTVTRDVWPELQIIIPHGFGRLSRHGAPVESRSLVRQLGTLDVKTGNTSRQLADGLRDLAGVFVHDDANGRRQLVPFANRE